LTAPIALGLAALGVLAVPVLWLRLRRKLESRRRRRARLEGLRDRRRE
jgi:hypothetical protein